MLPGSRAPVLVPVETHRRRRQKCYQGCLFREQLLTGCTSPRR